MKKLLVNGCSFTAGSYPWTITTPDISPIVWPRHLEDKFENVYNLAKGGESNDRIVRTTLDYCENNDMTDYVAIIQWSSPFRTEYWSTEDNEWINVVINNGSAWISEKANVTVSSSSDLQSGGTPKAAFGLNDQISNRYLDGDGTLRLREEKMEKALKKARKKLQTLSYENEMEWLNSFNDYDIAYYNNVLVLQNFFENKQVPYMFTSMSASDHPFMERKIYETMPTTLELNLKKLIDKSKWTKESLSCYKMDNFISQEDRHPNLNGNKLIAQALFKELMEKYGR